MSPPFVSARPRVRSIAGAAGAPVGMLARGGVLASTLAVARGGDADVGRFRPRVSRRARGFGSAPRSAAGPARRATATRALEGVSPRPPPRASLDRSRRPRVASPRVRTPRVGVGESARRDRPPRGRAPRARRAPAPAPRAMMEPSTYGHAAPSDASSFAAILSSNPFAPGYVRVRPRAGPRAATAEEKPSPSRRDPRMNVSLLSPSPRSPLAPPAPFAPDPPPPHPTTPARSTDDRPPSACTPSASSSRPWRSCPPP